MPSAAHASAAAPNVLRDALFTVEAGLGPQVVSLPTLLARLTTPGDPIRRLPRLTPEQRGPVWRFLVRCAAEAFQTLGRGLPGEEEAVPPLADAIARVLAERAGGEGAWALYHPDVGAPAFLQPPVPGGGTPEAADYKRGTVARLTLSMGGKAHERKTELARTLDPERLANALITFQGGVIYTKRNYEAPLMGSRSGKGSGTPYVGARLAGPLGATFRHDVRTTLTRWEAARLERGLRGSVWALWTVPWDGESSLQSTELDPAFIPCARLVRVGAPEADRRWSTLWLRPTAKPRVADATQNSGLGDVFLPLVPNPERPGAHKARGTMATGYRYDEVVRLLFGAGDQSAVPAPSVEALLTAPPPEGARLRFEGMAFDQGKTLGFHYRAVLVPQGNYLSDGTVAVLHVLHTRFLDVVKSAQSALQGAARILLLGTPKPNRHAAKKTQSGPQALQGAVDAVYIPRLLAAVRDVRARVDAAGDDAAEAADAAHEAAVDAWRAWVRTAALRIFEERVRFDVPSSTNARLHREVSAEAYLRHKLAGASQSGS